MLYSPKAVEFSGNSRLDAESLPEVFGAALGYSVSQPTEWDGMVIKDPFSTANGAVVVVAEGLESIAVEVSVGRYVANVRRITLASRVPFLC